MFKTKDSLGFALIPPIALLVAMLFAPVDASQRSLNSNAYETAAHQPVVAFEIPEYKAVRILGWVGRLLGGTPDAVQFEAITDNQSERR